MAINWTTKITNVNVAAKRADVNFTRTERINKKKTLLIILGTVIGISISLFAKVGVITPIEEPKPIELTIEQKVATMTVKEVIKVEQKQWDLTKAYYQRVILPDGSTQELKSKVSLTKEQWLAEAKEMYRQQLEMEKATLEVKICPTCGRPL
jgi:hypothetical protein